MSCIGGKTGDIFEKNEEEITLLLETWFDWLCEYFTLSGNFEQFMNSSQFKNH